MNARLKTLLFLSLSWFTLFCRIPQTMAEEENIVRAKVGILIKAADKMKSAKNRDRLMVGDLFRIYVHPEAMSFIYVVHGDNKRATLLNMSDLKPQGSILALPSGLDFYQVDGKSPVEAFTIICSPIEIKELATLTEPKMSLNKWAALEVDLMQKSKITLAQGSEPPFAIAGSVRGADQREGSDSFAGQLQIFSGRNLIVKKYEFQVQK